MQRNHSKWEKRRQRLAALKSRKALRLGWIRIGNNRRRIYATDAANNWPW